MLMGTLNECIVDMKTVKELETESADTKRQANADYNFKQLVLYLQKMTTEVGLAVDNSDFRPSVNVVSALKNFIELCDRVIQSGAANNATTAYISSESKKTYTALGEEWAEYFETATKNILSLLDTVKSILPDQSRAVFATNKIRKAVNWNTSVDNYNYLKQGMKEAEQILGDLDLDEDSSILSFLKLVSEGNATILDLTYEILAWVKAENIGDKIHIRFI